MGEGWKRAIAATKATRQTKIERDLNAAKEQGFAVGADAALELVHGLFSDSFHEVWRQTEITDAIEGLRKQIQGGAAMRKDSAK